MADRINWTDFPRLQDHDLFIVNHTAGTPSQLVVTLKD